MSVPVHSAKPTISACIISYNQERYIADAIAGAQMQELGYGYEIIVADDASTDGTRAIAESMAREDPRIRVLESTSNLGMHRNWLRAINACKGTYVALCEGDDHWTTPDKLHKQAAILDRQPQASACFTDASLILETSRHLRFNSYLLENDVDPKSYRYRLSDICMTNFIPTCTVMFRKSAELHFPDSYQQSPYADWFLHIHNALRGSLEILPETTSAYRIHESGAFSGLERSQLTDKKLRCLLALLDGFGKNKELKTLLHASITETLSLKATQTTGAERSAVRVWRKLFEKTGIATFAHLAIS